MRTKNMLGHMWRFWVALFAAMALLIGFSEWQSQNSGHKRVGEEMVPDEKIEHVTRVQVNSVNSDLNGEFTIWTQEPGSLEIKPAKFHVSSFKVFADIPEGKPMWVLKGMIMKTKYQDPKFDYTVAGHLEIHIRSEKDLEGGPWKYSYQYNKQLITREGWTEVLCCDK